MRKNKLSSCSHSSRPLPVGPSSLLLKFALSPPTLLNHVEEPSFKAEEK